MTINWIDSFPSLSALDEEALEALGRDSSVLSLPANKRVFGPGFAPQNFLLLIDGVIRVQQTASNGREIVLYRINAGESCALTTACLMGYERYQAEAVVEVDARAVAVPRKLFDELVSGSADFRRFVFAAFSHRMTSLFRVIEEVAFSRIDIRLAGKLLELSNDADILDVTHQNLATELGSVREVVSRQLGEFQRRGWVEVNRGQVHLLNRAALVGLQGSS